MPAPKIEARDLELLGRGLWSTPETDRRSLKLARLRLCEATARDPAAKSVTWSTTDKGHLLLRQRQVV